MFYYWFNLQEKKVDNSNYLQKRAFRSRRTFDGFQTKPSWKLEK